MSAKQQTTSATYYHLLLYRQYRIHQSHQTKSLVLFYRLNGSTNDVRANRFPTTSPQRANILKLPTNGKPFLRASASSQSCVSLQQDRRPTASAIFFSFFLLPASQRTYSATVHLIFYLTKVTYHQNIVATATHTTVFIFQRNYFHKTTIHCIDKYGF